MTWDSVFLFCSRAWLHELHLRRFNVCFELHMRLSCCVSYAISGCTGAITKSGGTVFRPLCVYVAASFVRCRWVLLGTGACVSEGGRSEPYQRGLHAGQQGVPYLSGSVQRAHRAHRGCPGTLCLHPISGVFITSPVSSPRLWCGSVRAVRQT